MNCVFVSFHHFFLEETACSGHHRSLVSVRQRCHGNEIASDVIVVLDVSLRLGGRHGWLSQAVHRLERLMTSNGIGTSVRNRYAIVGFGGLGNRSFPHSYYDEGGMNLVPVDKMPSLLQQVNHDKSGNVKDGYLAMVYALTTVPYRHDNCVALSIIFLTDGGRDVLRPHDQLQREDLKSFLECQDVLLHSFVDSRFKLHPEEFGLTPAQHNATVLATDGMGYSVYVSGLEDSTPVMIDKAVASRHIGSYGTTHSDYTQLTQDVRGTVWDVNLLTRNDRLVRTLVSALARKISADIPRHLRSVKCLCFGRSEGRAAVCVDKRDLCKCLASNLQVCSFSRECIEM